MHTEPSLFYAPPYERPIEDEFAWHLVKYLDVRAGLQYQVLEQGTGERPEPTDVVRVHYKGTLLDGTEFDSSHGRGEPAMFALAQVVPGWQEGIALMPVGSKYRLWIPSELAYGELGTPNGEIGPNATLVFEVELLEIVEVPTE